MTRKRGRDLELWILTDGSDGNDWESRAAWPATGIPTDLEKLANVRDVNQPLERSEHDASDRDGDVEQIMTGLLKVPTEFQILGNPSNAELAILEDAFFTGEPVAVAVCDGDPQATGTKGLYGDFEVLRFAQGAPVEGGWLVDVTLKLSALSDDDPERFTATAAP